MSESDNGLEYDDYGERMDEYAEGCPSCGEYEGNCDCCTECGETPEWCECGDENEFKADDAETEEGFL